MSLSIEANRKTVLTKVFRQSPRRILALIVAVFVLRALLAIAIIPPWQHPDEPQHFELVHILASQAKLDLSERSDVDLERSILGSMREHGWWRYYGEPEPTPLPSDFRDPELIRHIWRVETSPPVYYLLGAAAVKLTNPGSLTAEYYFLRWMALVLAVPTIICIWVGTRYLFGVVAAAGATLLTALHPQFVLMSTAVNPDVLVNFCGAVLWWQGARLLSRDSAAVSVAIMACATLIGVFTKRVAAPLVLMLIVVPVVAVRFGRPGVWRAAWPSVVAMAAGIILVGLSAVIWFGDEMVRLREYWSYLMTLSWPGSALDWAFFQQFTATLFDSAWLQAGWLRYPAPPGWLLIIRLLTVGAIAGCFIGLCRSRLMEWRPGLTLAGILVLIQMAAVYGGVYMNGLGAQGRYLFPVIGPFMALFWVGIHSWWPQRAWPLVGAGLLSVMFAFDVTSWLGVLVPAYAQ